MCNDEKHLEQLFIVEEMVLEFKQPATNLSQRAVKVALMIWPDFPYTKSI